MESLFLLMLVLLNKLFLSKMNHLLNNCLLNNYKIMMYPISHTVRWKNCNDSRPISGQNNKLSGKSFSTSNVFREYVPS